LSGKSDVISAVRRSVEPVLESMDKELVHVQFVQEYSRWILRLYIERKNSIGINVDELAEASRDISAVLDVEDVVPGSYSLEVSSPGLNRPLGKVEDCDRFSGRNAKVVTKNLIDGRRKFKGVLKGSEGQSVVIEVENNIACKIPWELVKKANLEGGPVSGEK